MGTRCITVVRSRWESQDWTTNAVIYRHWDGYPESHGQWLYDFLDGLAIVNGVGSDTPKKHANGPGRLAAQLVTRLQEDGHDPDILGCDVAEVGQEYEYRINVAYGNRGGTIELEVFDGPMTFFGVGGDQCTELLFKGTVEEWGTWLNTMT